MMAWLSQFITPSSITLLGAVLAAIGVFWSAERQSALSAQLVAKTDELAAKNAELAAKSEEIARLTKESLDAVTGGDSFCWITLADLGDQGGPAVFISSKGKHSVYDVTVQIANMRHFQDLKTGSPPPPGITPAQILARYTTFRAGTVSPYAGSILGRLPALSGDREVFNVHYFARNGSWSQRLVMQRIAGGWRTAMRVFKGERPTDPVLVESIDPGFPRNAAGQVDWE